MKIAMIGHKRVPGREGGVEVVVEELSVRLAREGHEVVLYNRACKGAEKRNEYKGCKIITVPTVNKKSLDAVIYSFLASIHALFGGYDIIHYHALGPSVMLLLPHFFGIRTAVTVHGMNYKTPKWKGFGAWYIAQGEKIAARYADELIVLNKETENYFEKEYHRKTRYIPNGVELKTIREPKQIKGNFGLDKGSYILFLSRVVPGKGLETLLEAYLKIETPKPKLVIAGASQHVPDFYKKVRSMAQGDPEILFTGFVQGEIMEELYSNAKLFVFPSEAEGMPMCLLEAMSYNCPCLVSDIPENMEVIKDNGWSFKVGDTESLKNALIEALKTKKTVSTRDYIAQKYNWDKVANQTKKAYQTAISQ